MHLEHIRVNIKRRAATTTTQPRLCSNHRLPAAQFASSMHSAALDRLDMDDNLRF
jgi:hypothetical protein